MGCNREEMKQILEGLYSAYTTPGDTLTFAGEETAAFKQNKAAIEDMFIDYTEKFLRFKEDTKVLAEKHGLQIETKLILKLS